MSKKKLLIEGWMLCFCLLFGGCTSNELENRKFPTLVTVSDEADFTSQWLNIAIIQN